jgi:hypothetical protein
MTLRLEAGDLGPVWIRLQGGLIHTDPDMSGAITAGSGPRESREL